MAVDNEEDEQLWIAADASDEDEGKDTDGPTENPELDEDEEKETDIELANMISVEDNGSLDFPARDLKAISPSSVRFLDWWKNIGAVVSHDDSFSLLHKEISSFFKVASLTAAEQEERNSTIDEIRKTVQGVWPSADIVVFGSSATGLALPGSDIDITIVPNAQELNTAAGLSRLGKRSSDPTTHQWLSAMAEGLKRRRLCQRVTKIAGAKVPILKCELTNGIECDISFNVNNGPKALSFVRAQMERFPSLGPLIMVLKCFLGQRSLNEVYTGGIGSYCLFVLVLAHVSEIFDWEAEQSAGEAGKEAEQPTEGTGKESEQPTEGTKDKGEGGGGLKADGSGEEPPADDKGEEDGGLKADGAGEEDPAPRPQTSSGVETRAGEQDAAGGVAEYQKQVDLGLLLVAFFARYGMLHDYVDDIVTLHPRLGQSKTSMGWLSELDPTLLSVEDPQRLGMDIGRASFKIDLVKAEFNRALALLKIAWKKGGDVLGTVVDLTRPRWQLGAYLSPNSATQGRKRKAVLGPKQEQLAVAPVKEPVNEKGDGTGPNKKKKRKKKGNKMVEAVAAKLVQLQEGAKLVQLQEGGKKRKGKKAKGQQMAQPSQEHMQEIEGLRPPQQEAGMAPVGGDEGEQAGAAFVDLCPPILPESMEQIDGSVAVNEDLAGDSAPKAAANQNAAAVESGKGSGDQGGEGVKESEQRSTARPKGAGGKGSGGEGRSRGVEVGRKGRGRLDSVGRTGKKLAGGRGRGSQVP